MSSTDLKAVSYPLRGYSGEDALKNELLHEVLQQVW